MSGTQNNELALLMRAIDFEELAETRYIPAEFVEKHTALKRDNREYGFLGMSACSAIEAQFLALYNADVVVRQDNYGFRVLTNEEAEAHGWSQVERHKRSFERWYHKTCVCVNVDNLDESQRKHHEHNRALHARILLHMREDELRADGEDPSG